MNPWWDRWIIYSAKSSINISFTLSSYKLETKGNNYSRSYNVFRLVLNVSHGHKFIMYYMMQKSRQKRIHLFKHHISSGVYCQCWIALVLQVSKKVYQHAKLWTNELAVYVHILWLFFIYKYF